MVFFKEDKKQKESRLNQDEHQVKTYMQISRETLDLFQYLTKDVQAPFLSPVRTCHPQTVFFMFV